MWCIVCYMEHLNVPVEDDGKTVYDRNVDIEDDPHAKEWWSDALNHRLNLRIPEWMFDELEQHAEYQRQEVSEVTRELIEYALMEVDFNEWQGINTYGRHTYGDVKCPACANENGLKLRWRRQRDRLTVIACRECNARFLPEEGRQAKNLARELQDIWFQYTFTRGDGMDPDSLIPKFEEFIDDPRGFVEAIEWDDDPDGSYRLRTEKERVYESLEQWEEKQ